MDNKVLRSYAELVTCLGISISSEMSLMNPGSVEKFYNKLKSVFSHQHPVGVVYFKAGKDSFYEGHFLNKEACVFSDPLHACVRQGKMNNSEMFHQTCCSYVHSIKMGGEKFSDLSSLFYAASRTTMKNGLERISIEI